MILQRSVHPDSTLLRPIERAQARRSLGIDSDLFGGIDVWNCYELTWLELSGRPVALVGRMSYPADTEFLIESKSLKLYLGSYHFTRWASTAAVRCALEEDLSRALNTPECRVEFFDLNSQALQIASLPGILIDSEKIPEWEECAPQPGALQSGGEIVQEVLSSNLLRSLCPLSGQPDFASVILAYRGSQINRAGLLQYLVSLRDHRGFHESCCEMIFMDVWQCCAPRELAVGCFYTRRGGIDINPIRCSPGARNFLSSSRLVRQ